VTTPATTSKCQLWHSGLRHRGIGRYCGSGNCGLLGLAELVEAQKGAGDPLGAGLQGKGKVAILWVDLQGRAGEARKIVRYNRLTFPVVVDAHGASIKAWNIQAYPFWVLLDSRGRVIEARLKPQTIAQLKHLLGEAK
jgi:hypothetical protein